MEEDFSPVRTVLTADVNKGDSCIEVEDASCIYPGDVVLVGQDEYPYSDAFLIDATRGNRLVGEELLITAKAGDPVVKYGRIPRPIQWATMLLIKDKRVPIGIRGTEDDPDSPRFFADRLTSESVEGYSYSLAQLPTMYGFGGGTWTTGNPEVDDILQQYANPMLYIGSTSSGFYSRW